MANPKTTGGTHELQERYADNIVRLMRKYMKIRNTFSRDYEGNPTAGAVKVPVRNMDVAVQDYNVVNGCELTTSETTYLNVLVDKHKAVNELIDGYEAAAVPDNISAQRQESAAYSLGMTFEKNAINALLTKGQASAMSDCTAENVYKNILKDISRVHRQGVEKSEIRVALSDDTELLLLENEKYSNSASQIGAELAREGIVGKINGVYTLTEDLGKKDNKDVEYIVYAIPWCQKIDEWSVKPQIKDLADGKHIGASALQGRQEFTDVVTDERAVVYKTRDAQISG